MKVGNASRANKTSRVLVMILSILMILPLMAIQANGASNTTRPTYANQPKEGYATLAEAATAFPDNIYCNRYAYPQFYGSSEDYYGWMAVSKEDYERAFKTGFDTREQIVEVFGEFTPYFDQKGYAKDPRQGFSESASFDAMLRASHTYGDVYNNRDGKWFLEPTAPKEKFIGSGVPIAKGWNFSQVSWVMEYHPTIESIIAAHPNSGYYLYSEDLGTWLNYNTPIGVHGNPHGPFSTKAEAEQAANNEAANTTEDIKCIEVWQNEHTGKWFSTVEYVLHLR